MAKTPKSFRLSDLAIEKLAAMAKRRNVSESLIVEQLIVGPDVVADNDRGSASVARSRMQYLKSGDIDHEKLAAAQVTHGMTVERKRR